MIKPRGMQRAGNDYDNCLAALRWALSNAQGQVAMALAGSLWWFWYRRGLFKLGRDMLEVVLYLSTRGLARARHRAQWPGVHLPDRADYAASLACHREGLALRCRWGDATGRATVLHNMGLTAYMMGDYSQALAWLDDSLSADPSADPMQAGAQASSVWTGRICRRPAIGWNARMTCMKLPEGWGQAFVMHNLAEVLRELGELTMAKQLAHTSLRIFEALGEGHHRPDPQSVLAQIAGDEGDYATAQALADLARGRCCHKMWSSRLRCDCFRPSWL